MVKNFKPTDNGGYVTVNNNGFFPDGRKTLRIKCSDRSSIEFVDGDDGDDGDESVTTTVTAAKPSQPPETDEEAIARIRERFEQLTQFTKAATAGELRAIIVSGPPGVGKSFGVEQEIEKATLLDQIAGRKLSAEVVKGAASPIGLYQTLYKYSDPNCVVVFDDCDSILLDDDSLNLLKGALDTGKRRRISWLTESSTLRNEGIPTTFDFKGSVIFITNLKFDKMRSQKLRDQLAALQDRCHYLDLTLDTERDKLLRIRQIAGDGELFADYDLTQEQQDEIIDFMDNKKTRLRDISLRMALKIADLRRSFPGTWQRMAETTCVKPQD
jgi:hypothetical protein